MAPPEPGSLERQAVGVLASPSNPEGFNIQKDIHVRGCLFVFVAHKGLNWNTIEKTALAWKYTLQMLGLSSSFAV